MSQLFRMFIDIALWRRGPQDLPASTALACLVAAFYAFISAIQVGMGGSGFWATLLLTLIDLALQAVWLWGLLTFFAKRPRFLQSFTAFLGVGALLAVMDILISVVMNQLGVSDISPSNPWPLLYVGLVLMLLGRILQQALERSLFLGMTLTLVIMVTINLVSMPLLPGR